MIGLFLAYAAGKSVQRSRQRRAERPYGYEEFEFLLLMSAVAIGAAWPIHLGYALTKWGLHLGWSITIATITGIIGLATGAGYIVIGIAYASIWLTVLITRGVAQEQAAWEEACCDYGVGLCTCRRRDTDQT